tara:strand:+ start:48 stop:1094 length:1047 start_codon:yes stop_codon:yes gene_type:complete
MKSTFKNLAIKITAKLLQQPPIEQQLADNSIQLSQPLPELANEPSPYTLALSGSKMSTSDRDDIVFITSRFRSGSTLLWNLFRKTPQCTAYYEPFNERQWFNKQMRGANVDTTHRGVDDYWTEYDNLSGLSQTYNENWIHSALYMSEHSWDPQMKRYIEQMIETAPGRPILQFNRIDFRLPWIKQHFPNAKILHLYRHPRDQWCSFLTDHELMNKDDVIHTYQDAFYLDVWCHDLAKHYPVLDKRNTPQPYQRFYYLWKLSYLHGLKFSDLGISFETLTTAPQQSISDIFDILGIAKNNIDSLVDVIKAPPPERWRKYADESWFLQHESICERNLSLMLKNFPIADHI